MLTYPFCILRILCILNTHFLGNTFPLLGILSNIVLGHISMMYYFRQSSNMGHQLLFCRTLSRSRILHSVLITQPPIYSIQIQWLSSSSYMKSPKFDNSIVRRSKSTQHEQFPFKVQFISSQERIESGKEPTSEDQPVHLRNSRRHQENQRDPVQPHKADEQHESRAHKKIVLSRIMTV